MSQSKKMKEETQKGLNSLLGNMQKFQNPQQKITAIQEHTQFSEVEIQNIVPNPKNPRTIFNEEQLEELKNSIQLHGLIQPITVIKLEGNRFQIIAGERRWRAAQKAGLKKVPAYIRKANDQEIVEWAIIENLQRENLNPIETALGLQRMMEELSYTQEQVAERIGKDRSTVSNTIRLLRLPPDVQLALKENRISAGHARTIIGIEHIDLQLSLLKEIEAKGLSVRQTELLAKSYTQNPASKATKAKTEPSSAPAKDVHTKKVEEELNSYLQAKVSISLPTANASGKIEIFFKDVAMLNRIFSTMSKKH